MGRALVDELRRRSWPVVAATRTGGGNSVAVGCIGPQTDWRRSLEGVETVIHCAARVHMLADRASDPLTAYREVNRDGTLNLARQAAEAGARRLVFVSSIKVNGEETQPGAPFTAGDVPRPLDGYGISKDEAEAGLRALAATTGLEVVIVRPPLVYGPGVKANFAGMMRVLARGLPLPLGRATRNRRSLVGIDNLVDLLIACADSPAAAGQTFLVSDGEDLSTAALLRRLAAAIGRPARLLPVPVTLLEAGAALLGKRQVAKRLLGSLQVDISETRRILGWTPPLTVDQALRRAAASISQ